MSLHTIALFFLTCVAVSMTPGPNMFFAMSVGLRFGQGRAVWAGLGMCVALGLMATVSALGLGALLTTSVTAFEIVRWAGAAYLIWLGIAAWRAPAEPTGDKAADDTGTPRRLFVRGLFVSASNPKAMVFMTALFPQFIEPSQPLGPQLAALIAVMLPVELASIMVYAFGGGALAAKLADGRAARTVNRLTGSLLIGAGGLLALARRA